MSPLRDPDIFRFNFAVRFLFFPDEQFEREVYWVSNN